MEWILKYWPVLLVVINLLTAWGAWSFKQATVSRDDFSDLVTAMTSRVEKLELDLFKQLNQHDKRMIAFEHEIKHMPNHGDLKNIYDKLDGVNKTLSRVESTTDGLGRLMSLINQHLIQKSESGS